MEIDKKLQNAKKDIPYAFEIFPKEKKQYEGVLGTFLENAAKNDSFVITYPKDATESFLWHWIKSVYIHYEKDLPDLKDIFGKLSINMLKVTSFVLASKFFPAITVANTVTHSILSGMSSSQGIINATHTVYQKASYNKTKEEKEAIALKALTAFRDEAKFLHDHETFIIAAVRLLYDLSQSKDIIFLIEDMERLNLLDIQFLRMYYSLFKDKNSIVTLKESIEQKYKFTQEIASAILTICCWGEVNPINYKIGDEVEEHIEELLKFRRFLHRYRMIDNQYSKTKYNVIDPGIFIARGDILEILQTELNKVTTDRVPILRRVEGNSGMGKTSLINNFMKGLNKEEVLTVYMGFSGESLDIKDAFTEMRSSLSKLKLELDPTIVQSILKVIKDKSMKNEEKINRIKRVMNLSMDTESIMTPIWKAINEDQGLGVIADSIGLIATLKDTWRINQSRKSLFFKKEKKIDGFQDEQRSLENIFDELLGSFAEVFEKAKELNKTILWAIDDIQWIDIDSAIFLQRIIRMIQVREIPIYFVMLDRGADLESRKQSKQGQELIELTAYINETFHLEGFDEENVIELIEEGVNSTNKEISVQVGKLLWEWITKNHNHLKIEPIFVVEAMNLLVDETKTENNVLNRNPITRKWNWVTEDIEEISEQIKQYLKKWDTRNVYDKETELYKKFTPCMIAVIEERLYRLKNHFLEVDFVELLENGAFVGEPIHFTLLFQFVMGEETSKSVHGIEELEHSYKIIAKYLPDMFDNSRWLMYLFGHAIYKDYLYLKFLQGKEEQLIKSYHNNLFELLDHFIDENNTDAPNYFIESLALQAVHHAEKSENPMHDERLIQYYIELSDFYLEKFKLSTACDYAERGFNLALKTCTEADPLLILSTDNFIEKLIENGNYSKATEVALNLRNWIFGSRRKEIMEYFGVDYFKILRSLAKAFSYDDQFRNEGILILQLLIELQEEIKDINYLSDLNLLGILQMKENLVNDAIDTLEKARDENRHIAGPDEMKIIESNLIGAYLAIDHKKAKQLREQMNERELGADNNLQSLMLLNNELMSRRNMTGNIDELFSIILKYNEILTSVQNLLEDAQDPRILKIKNNLGVTYYKLGCVSANEQKRKFFEDAENIQQEIIDTVDRERVEFSDLQIYYLNLAETYRGQKRYPEARAILQDRLELIKPDKHYQKVQFLNKLGRIELDDNNLDDAVSFLEEACEASKQLQPSESERLVCQENVSEAYYRKYTASNKKNIQYLLKAKRVLELVNTEYSTHYDLTHPDSLNVRTKLDVLTDEYQEIYKKVLKNLGRNDACYCGSRKKYKNCCLVPVTTRNMSKNAGETDPF